METGSSREGPGRAVGALRSAELVVLIVSDVLLVLSSLSPHFSAGPSPYYLINRLSRKSQLLGQLTGLALLSFKSEVRVKSKLK